MQCGSSCTAGTGLGETITYNPANTGTYYLVVKWVSGLGPFTLRVSRLPTVTDIGALASGRNSYAYAVNASGELTGYGDPGYWPNAIDWANGILTDINDHYSYGYGINDSRLIVGDDISCARAFKWTPSSGRTVLGTVSGFADSRARAVNNSGVIVGYGRNGSSVNRALRWNAGASVPTDLHSLRGSTPSYESYAYAINSDAYIVGTSVTSSGYNHPFILGPGSTLYLDTDGSDLGTLGGNSGAAYGVNIYRQIVGGSWNSTGAWHASFKTADSGTGQGFTDLGTIAGAPSSTAYGINGNGVVVGAYGGSGTCAFVWQYNPNGQAIQPLWDLSGLAGFSHAGSSAEAVNDTGQIVGWYYNVNNQLHGFILTPAP